MGGAAAAVRSMETHVLDVPARRAIEGVVLRYGMFYGLETPSTVAMIELVRKRRLPVVRGDCRAAHVAVGCSMMLKCTMCRRRCDKTIRTNSIRPVSVGTVKKSIDTADAR